MASGSWILCQISGVDRNGFDTGTVGMILHNLQKKIYLKSLGIELNAKMMHLIHIVTCVVFYCFSKFNDQNVNRMHQWKYQFKKTYLRSTCMKNWLNHFCFIWLNDTYHVKREHSTLISCLFYVRCKNIFVGILSCSETITQTQNITQYTHRIGSASATTAFGWCNTDFIFIFIPLYFASLFISFSHICCIKKDFMLSFFTLVVFMMYTYSFFRWYVCRENRMENDLCQ